ncbi:hypothetical protein A8U91_02679 [Halomonas elongata]|uniref:Uncharacterized protein n=1 Tax=Halomonas elongata TaxID=2746 RepID=A0A1B8P7M0_HALEL|nr:hypothetical protein A8U91_02679 [Halomonas elongata]
MSQPRRGWAWDCKYAWSPTFIIQAYCLLERQMALTAEQKAAIVNEYGRGENDTGSPRFRWPC